MLERVTLRTIAISLPLLTLGLIAGFIRLRRDGGGVDALMAATIAHLARLRRSSSRCGRPAAGRRTSRSLGFALVILVRIALAGSHF